MAIRGFIIAIENYANIEHGYAPTLPGTIQSGSAFYDWLRTTKNLDAKDIFFCTEANIPERTAGATRDEIAKEIRRLGKEGKDQTEELYFFFCGHGFSFTDLPRKRRDNVIVCADFENNEDSGNCCLKLDEIQWFLRSTLGGEKCDHYYFIDACRTELRSDEIDVGSLGKMPDPSMLGEPTVYTLFSTRPGELAAVASNFPKALIDGLKGKGIAKVWSKKDHEAMVVIFDALKDYVQGRLTGQSVTRSLDGERDGEILLLKPAPNFTCTVTIEDGAGGDVFDYELRPARHQAALSQGQFVGPAHALAHCVPDHYYLTIRSAAAPCANVDPLPILLYDDCTVRFRKSGGAVAWQPPMPGPEPLAPLDLRLPLRATAFLRNLSTGDHVELAGSEIRALPAGRYAVRLQEAESGTPLEKREVTLEPGKTASLDFSQFRSSPLRTAILGMVPGEHQAGAVDFSESLGPLPDQDLGLWLALIGGSRILDQPGYYWKLGHLPLMSLDRLPPGHSTIYFLAAFDDPAIRPRVGLTGGSTEWISPKPVEAIPGLFEHAMEARPFGQYWPVWGPWTQPLLSFDVGGQPPITITSCLSPNRVTFITLTTDENGDIQIGQFLLPPKHLWDFLDPNVSATLRNPGKLRSVKALAQAQRLFGHRRALFAGARERQLWDLLYLKWLDPIMAAMAAYELIRRNEREHLSEVVENLNRYFAEVPDTHAITRLSNGQGEMRGLPLFLEGLRAFPNAFEHLPLPHAKLDFQSSWTLWRGAVPPPRT